MDTRRTLNQLDPPDWGHAPVNATPLIEKCHAARDKPLGELTVEGRSHACGQSIGLHILVPIALEWLDENPLTNGDFYRGDLLAEVLRVDPLFWASHYEHAMEVAAIVEGLENTIVNSHTYLPSSAPPSLA